MICVRLVTMTVPDQGITGIDDERLMARVEEESRIFMTMDKGIANIRAYSPGRFAGLVLLRPNQAGRGAVLSFVRARLTQILDLELKGRVVVASETGIRIR